MKLKSIWDKGFSIVRDGKEIQLTKEEISKIQEQLDVAYGIESMACFLDEAEPDEDEDIIDLLNNVENDDLPYEIWHNFLDTIFEDTGTIEREIVKQNAKEYIEALKGGRGYELSI